MECSNFRKIKIMSHILKLFERIIHHKLRTIVEFGNSHFVFRRGRSSINRVHVVAINFLQETYKKKDQYLHIVSVDLEKALLSPQIFIMEHQANDRDSRVVRQCDTGHV